jgi:hypothetical protein
MAACHIEMAVSWRAGGAAIVELLGVWHHGATFHGAASEAPWRQRCQLVAVVSSMQCMLVPTAGSMTRIVRQRAAQRVKSAMLACAAGHEGAG